MARMAGLPGPEQYYRDPASPEAQQARQAISQQEQQQQQMQHEMQIQQMQFQYSLLTDVEKVKGEFKAQSDQLKAMIDMFAQRVKLAEVEQKGDQTEAQQEIDRLQVVASNRKGSSDG
jgi:hypothetical protein